MVAREHQRARSLQVLGALDHETAAGDAQEQPGAGPLEGQGRAPAGQDGGREPEGRDEDERGQGQVHRVRGASRAPRGLDRAILGHRGQESQPARRRRPRPPPERAGRVELARGRAADLSAGGLRHRARRHQAHHVWGQPDGSGHAVDHLGLDPCAPPRIGGAGLRHDHQALGPQLRTVHADGGDAALAYPFDGGHDFLDLLGDQVAAALDDQVLAPSRDVDVAVRAEGQVAAVHPPAGDHGRRRRLGLMVVTGGHRRPAEDEPAHAAVGHIRARVVQDPHLVAGQRSAHGDEPQRAGIVRGCGLGAAEPLERLAGHAAHDRAAAHGREAEGHRVLGQAVHRHERLAAEAVGREPPREPLQRVRDDRLRAVERAAPRREVQALQRRVRDLPHAELVGEVGRARERGPTRVDGPEPPLRPRQEGERALDGDGQARVHAEEPGADEPHVVVERQPARAHVVGPHLEGGGDAPDVGQQVVVGEEHALRVARAARSVLDERGIGARALRRGPGRAGPRQLRRGRHRAKRRHLGLQRARQRRGARHGDEEPDTRVAQDRGLARGVLLETVEAHRRVDGDGHGARDQDPLERAEEIRARGKHQRDGVAL